MNSESIGQELIDYIKNHACLPKHANYRHQYNGHGSDYKCYIDWAVKDDGLPSTYSKIIEIVIPRETLDDYPCYKDKTKAKNKLVLIIDDFISHFNPTTSPSPYTLRPIIPILIKSEDICNY
ncbi:hypothetical protein [Cysteiniphilum sp. 6C5]|uniref:hypothetical protein n=1 Tax=unclassified Cysteiniphilum TaxID=2610889 RepID=UPI003F87A483